MPEVGTGISNIMTTKPSRFIGDGGYKVKRVNVLDKLKRFFEKYIGI